jgi:hypothetical protein
MSHTHIIEQVTYTRFLYIRAHTKKERGTWGRVGGGREERGRRGGGSL